MKFKFLLREESVIIICIRREVCVYFNIIRDNSLI
jgi:hypothetical protein